MSFRKNDNAKLIIIKKKCHTDKPAILYNLYPQHVEKESKEYLDRVSYYFRHLYYIIRERYLSFIFLKKDKKS